MSDRHEGTEVGIDSGAGFGSGPGDGAGGGAGGGRRLDGNAAAGPLSELFTVDLVAAVSTCAHCGRDAALGEHLVYADAPALVVRCPTCTGVVLRYASAGGRIRIDLSGARLVVLDVSNAP